MVLFRRRSRDGETARGEQLERVVSEREALIQLCVYALDRAHSTGVAHKISEGLADVGVRAVHPDGQRFDPAVHEAGATVGTADPALDGVIAETEMPGFADRNAVVRAPVVTVFRLDSRRS